MNGDDLAPKINLYEVLMSIQNDVSALKTDVAWMKKLFIVVIIGGGGILGIDMSGVI